MRAVYFDMDGTIADLFGIENWLQYLENEKTKPYREAKPLVNMRELSREIHRLQSIGYKIGIITWLSGCGTDEYHRRVKTTKENWLKNHIGSVTFDEIHIVKYGTPKSSLGNGILFDDSRKNREEWNNANYENLAFDVCNIIEVLKNLT